MADTDNRQYQSLSLDELYNLLFNATRNMLNACNGKDHESFIDRQNEVIFIRSLIEEKRAEMRVNELGQRSI